MFSELTMRFINKNKILFMSYVVNTRTVSLNSTFGSGDGSVVRAPDS